MKGVTLTFFEFLYCVADSSGSGSPGEPYCMQACDSDHALDCYVAHCLIIRFVIYVYI